MSMQVAILRHVEDEVVLDCNRITSSGLASKHKNCYKNLCTSFNHTSFKRLRYLVFLEILRWHFSLHFQLIRFHL